MSATTSTPGPSWSGWAYSAGSSSPVASGTRTSRRAEGAGLAVDGASGWHMSGPLRLVAGRGEPRHHVPGEQLGRADCLRHGHVAEVDQQARLDVTVVIADHLELPGHLVGVADQELLLGDACLEGALLQGEHQVLVARVLVGGVLAPGRDRLQLPGLVVLEVDLAAAAGLGG